MSVNNKKENIYFIANINTVSNQEAKNYKLSKYINNSNNVRHKKLYSVNNNVHVDMKEDGITLENILFTQTQFIHKYKELAA